MDLVLSYSKKQEKVYNEPNVYFFVKTNEDYTKNY